jgi:histidine triad (HIT) family protein
MECIFCKIIRREIPAEIIFENDHVLGFRDINPQAPTHILVIPKQHVVNFNNLVSKDIWDELLDGIQIIVKEEGVDQSGYRVVINCGGHGGQTVDHLHCHILGGRLMAWPPG